MHAATSRCAALAAVTLLAITVTAPAPASAQDVDDLEVRLSGEYQLRYRATGGQDFVDGGGAGFFRHRARLAAIFDYSDVIGLFLQVQDVRVWGEESDPAADFSADGLDLHQGFLTVRGPLGMELRLGRQEVGLLKQRLIGVSSFIEQGRAFDAVRLRWELPERDTLIDLFGAFVDSQLPADNPRTDTVFGLALRHRFADLFAPALIVVSDTDDGTDRTRVTLGLVVEGKARFGLEYTAEGYVQLGSEGDTDILAWLAGARVRYTFDHDVAPFVEVFADVVSGDDDPTDGERRAFDTLFGSNHARYGEMDFFTNLPVDTGERGLVDVGGAVGVRVGEALQLSP